MARKASFGGAVVVVTGASSGIGRATALAFAGRGARLALAARRADLLEEVAEGCRAVGGEAVAVPTDVTDIDAVRRLAQAAIGAFGRIDVWVNNAGVGAVGGFVETPAEAHRRVIETNLVGYVNGAHAALTWFETQGSGVLVNNISFGAWAPAPLAAAYAASKFGLRGFSESLAAELADWPAIHVCDVFPSFIDTPGIQHGANYTGRALKPAPPVFDPARVAAAIVGMAQRPRRAATVGATANLVRLAHAVAPRLVGRATLRFMQLYLRQADPSPVTDGNLFAPVAVGRTERGGWQGQNRSLAIAGAALLGVAAVLLIPAVALRRR